MFVLFSTLSVVGLCIASLPAPVRLSADGFIAFPDAGAARALTPQPVFSFVPPMEEGVTQRGLSMANYSVVVRLRSTVVWASGFVEAVNSSLPFGGIRCGVKLQSAEVYQWTAQWGASDGRVSPESSPQTIITGLYSEEDWQEAQWLGNGQDEFKTSISVPSRDVRALVYVAAPGGAVVSVNGVTVSADPIGVSAWADFTQSITYTVVDISTTLKDLVNATVGVSVGCGGWCPSAALAWSHSHRPLHTPAATLPVARILVKVKTIDDNIERFWASSASSFEGRKSRSLINSPWFGSVMDWRSLDSGGGAWSPARAVPQNTTMLDIPDTLRLLPVNEARVRDGPSPKTVTGCGDGCFVYDLGRIIVGQAFVASGSYQGFVGNLTLEYCELLRDKGKGVCVRQEQGYLDRGVTDVHLLDATTNIDLNASFTWHSFQYVVVRAAGSGSFRGHTTDVKPVWTVANLEPTGMVRTDSDHLNQLQMMIQTGHISSMASYLPGMDPTREKHAWLGDALDAAESSMFNYGTLGVYRYFLDQVSDSQASDPSNKTGFVPVVVPCHQGVDSKSNDLSWTSAFPLMASYALQYYDADLGHQQNLHSWVDRQLTDANGSIPSFFTYGDDGEVAQGQPSGARDAGPGSAAGYFVLSLQGLANVALAQGRDSDAKQLDETLKHMKDLYNQLYWNSTLRGYTRHHEGLQTLNSLALLAEIPPTEYMNSTKKALLDDVAGRAYALTVGSVGQKFILQALSGLGSQGHDYALQMVLRQDFPGWGYWVSQNASTCWEHWPGAPGKDTHNHIWLCGGVGEWMYKRLAGISSLERGFLRVRIAPKISWTPGLGPNAVNGSVSTMRGLVQSRWTRPESSSETLDLSIKIPTGVHSEVRLPLLCGGKANPQRVIERVEGAPVWKDGKVSSPLPQGITSASLVYDTGKAELWLEVLSGYYVFSVYCT